MLKNGLQTLTIAYKYLQMLKFVLQWRIAISYRQLMQTDDIDMNMVVFTTKNVMKNGLPVVRVYHGNDGYWQFFDAVSTNAGENVMLVSMEQVLKTDDTLKKILNMDPSHFASRTDKNQSWTIEEYTEEEE